MERDDLEPAVPTVEAPPCSDRAGSIPWSGYVRTAPPPFWPWLWTESFESELSVPDIQSLLRLLARRTMVATVRQ